jgi:hypothetical protein
MSWKQYRRQLVFSLLASTAIPNLGWTLEPSGSTVAVSSNAQATGPGGDRILNAPGDVFQGDTIVTDTNGQAQIVFVDDTRFVVGPNSKVLIDEFVFNPDGTARDVALNTLRGTFRFISGKSPHEVYAINTPTMTIGVRGTMINVRVLGSGQSYANWQEGTGTACVVPENSQSLLRTQCTSVEVGGLIGAPPGGGFTDFRPGEIQQVLDTISNGLGTGVGSGFGGGGAGEPDTETPADHNHGPY